jgi:hypothetical protein
MANTFRMKLNDFAQEHARIGDALESARQSMTDTGAYRFKLNRVRDAHRKMGAMLDSAEACLTGDEPMQPRGAESEPRGAADSALSGGTSIYRAFPDMLRLQNR